MNTLVRYIKTMWSKRRTIVVCVLSLFAVSLWAYSLVGDVEVPYSGVWRNHSTKNCPESCTYVLCDGVMCDGPGSRCQAWERCGPPISGRCKKLLFGWDCVPAKD